MIRIYFPPNDTDRIMDIWLNGNKQAHCFIPESYWESCAHKVQSLLSQADVFIWEEEGLIKGFAGMQGNYLAGIFVDRAFRCTGIGKKLLDFIKKRYPSFSLSVYKENRRALEFYLREGLTITAEGMDEATGHAEYTLTWNPQGA